MMVKDKHPLVYEVRKTRSTGAHVQVLDRRRRKTGPDWELICVTHGTKIDGEARLKAEARAHAPQDWCADCKKVATKAKQPSSRSSRSKAPAAA
jgi:hypothetical protein